MKIVMGFFVVLMVMLTAGLFGCAHARCPDMVIGEDGMITRESMSARLACMLNDPPTRGFGSGGTINITVDN